MSQEKGTVGKKKCGLEQNLEFWDGRDQYKWKNLKAKEESKGKRITMDEKSGREKYETKK